MELKFVLDKRQEIETQDKLKTVYIFRPVEQGLKKIIEIKIKEEEGGEIAGRLGFPHYIGDTVNISIGAKETQKKLVEEEKP